MQERDVTVARDGTQLLERPPTGQVGVAEPEPRPEVQQEVQAMLQQGREPAYDLVVLGSGPGGYVAAIRATQLGLRTAVIEKGLLGGTCLNVGCIPTKAMLASVEALAVARRGSEFGFKANSIEPDYPAMVKRRNRVVEQNRAGVQHLLKKAGATVLPGQGRFVSPHLLEVTGESGTERVQARHAIIATGSVPARAPIPGADSPGVVTSDDLLTLSEAPKSMVVIGAGAVGLEWGDIYHALGTKITVIEMLDRILPPADAEISQALARSFQKKGFELHVSARVDRIEPGRDGLTVHFTGPKGEGKATAEIVLLATGRRAFTDGAGLEEIGVKLERGRVVVDERMQTSVPDVYAIGDCVSRFQLAHVASREGEVAVENIAGHPTKMDYRTVPSCVYTSPEVAWVGLTEAQAREQYEGVKVGSFPFMALGKARAIGEREGFIKVVADEKYGQVLGVHMIGAHVTDLIAEPTTAMAMEATAEEFASTIHAHPTLAEGLMEAAADALGHAIHKG
jgi:dihydrolipoamide dehydrogenase